MAVDADDVVWLLGIMRQCGASPIVAGGWGVDALVGAQTRPHRDLDLLVEDELLPAVTDRLLGVGFVVTTDWLPARLELGDPHGRHVDLHPIFDDGHGGWWQHGLDGAVFEHPSTVLTAGTIGGLAVSCLTPARQLELHSGYEPREHDLLDLAVIAGLVDRQ